MKRVYEFLEDYWRHIMIGVVVVIAGYFLIFDGMSTLTPGFSLTELAAHHSSSSLSIIGHNPLNAPYKLLLWVPIALNHHSILLARLVAGIFAVISIVLFYFIVHNLFSHRIAILASVLFATSSGFLHAAHLGTPLVLQIFGIVALLALLPFYHMSKTRLFPLYLAAITLTVLLYIPGMFWFIAVGFAVLNKRLFSAFRMLALKHQIIIGAIIALLITPLVWACVNQPHLALTSLALPNTLPSWSAIASRASNLAQSLFWSGQGPAEIMLVGAPLLTIVEFGLLFIGIGVQFKQPRLRSNLFVIGAMLFIVLLIILGGVINYVTLTPIFSLLVASGLFYLLAQWHKVFPVNPVAHIIGTTLLFALIAAPILYHTRAFFVAWPHSSATHAAFSETQPAKYIEPTKQNAPQKVPAGSTF